MVQVSIHKGINHASKFSSLNCTMPLVCTTYDMLNIHPVNEQQYRCANSSNANKRV